jgi:Fe-S oxidoreductase
MSTTNMLWFRQDDWIDTVQWLEDEARMDIKNVRIPLDREGAEVMYITHGLEAKFMTYLLTNIAKIMAVAGINWTMPSTDGWDLTNKGFYASDFETVSMINRIQYETAFRFKVKKIVIGECGHAFRVALHDGLRWLGWKESPVPYIHSVQFFYELIREEKIKIAKKLKEPVTVHDPCNIVRGGGLGDMIRFIIRETCEDFTDVNPRYEHNYCCSAGGGLIDSGPPASSARLKGGRVKAKQLRITGAKIVIAPCHTCHAGIADLIAHYKLGMNVKYLSDIIVETMEIPEKLKHYS